MVASMAFACASASPLRLITRAPTILPRDANGAEFASGAGRDASTGIELYRVVAIDGQRKGQACARIRLLVISFHAIHGGATARKVSAIQ